MPGGRFGSGCVNGFRHVAIGKVGKQLCSSFHLLLMTFDDDLDVSCDYDEQRERASERSLAAQKPLSNNTEATQQVSRAE